MIDREDMLALTRRMTVKRTSMTRIAGGYMDSDGCIDGTFNIAFLKLSLADREKNLQIAKKVPFAETNQNLQEYKFLQENMQNDSLWKLLMGMRACGLKNDALMDTFYDLVMETCHPGKEYAVLMFHDRYDIPKKGTDKERLGESEEMFEYLICAVCPLKGEYEPGRPEWGFLFPAFTEQCADLNHVQFYQADTQKTQTAFLKRLLGV